MKILSLFVFALGFLQTFLIHFSKGLNYLHEFGWNRPQSLNAARSRWQLCPSWRVFHIVSLDELTHSHKAHMQPGLPWCKGQRDKALLPQESYSQWRCYLVNSPGFLWAQFRGASLPLCAIKESGRHLVQSVCKVHRCNKCHSQEYKQAAALLHYWIFTPVCQNLGIY